MRQRAGGGGRVSRVQKYLGLAAKSRKGSVRLAGAAVVGSRTGMDADVVFALARAALLDLDPDEARALAAVLTPLLARLDGLPPARAEAAPGPVPGAGGAEARGDVGRADVPRPPLPRSLALAGVPAVTSAGLVQVGGRAAEAEGPG